MRKPRGCGAWWVGWKRGAARQNCAENGDYVYKAALANWTPIGGKREFDAAISFSGASGTIFDSLVVPRAPGFKQRVIITITASIANTTGGTTGGVNILATGTGASVLFAGGPTVTLANSGASYAAMAVIEIAAGTGNCTIQLQASASFGALVVNGIRASRLLVEGEW